MSEQEHGIGFLRVLADAADAIVSRARLANTSGKTFGGARDLYETCGYKRELFASDYRSRYKRNAIAARVVEAKPLDTWRGGFDVIEDPNLDKDTEFEKTWDALNKRLKISTVMQRADILAGIGRYAIILIGAPGEMSEPLEKCTADEIAYLSVYAEDDAPIKDLDIDSKSPRFGQPVFYEVKRTNPQGRSGTSGAIVGKRVHYTRVIHVADGLLDDMVYGTPRLERVWNLIDDLEKITGGGAEAFWMRANQGMHVNIDSALNPTTDEIDAMKADIEEYRHKLKRVIRTRGAEIKTLGSDTADFKGPQSAVVEQISAGTGIPTRVLMGSEQGKLAAEQDSVKYYRMIEARRADYGDSQVVRPTIDRFIALQALPTPAQPYTVNWSQVRTMDEDEKASLASKLAQINSTQGEIVVTRDEIREMLGREPLEEDQAMLGVLEAAINHGRVDVIERVLGMKIAPVVKQDPELKTQLESLRAAIVAQPTGTPGPSPELLHLLDSVAALAARETPAPQVHVDGANIEVHVPPTPVQEPRKRVVKIARDENGLMTGFEEVD